MKTKMTTMVFAIMRTEKNNDGDYNDEIQYDDDGDYNDEIQDDDDGDNHDENQDDDDDDCNDASKESIHCINVSDDERTVNSTYTYVGC